MNKSSKMPVVCLSQTYISTLQKDSICPVLRLPKQGVLIDYMAILSFFLS